MQVTYFSQLKPGQVVSFVYMGGSTPGSSRRVKVNNVSRHNMTGKDLNKDEYRTFNQNSVRGHIVVENPVVTKTTAIHFVNARNEIMQAVNRATGEQLAAVYQVLFCKPSKWNSYLASVEVETPVKTFNLDGKTVTVDELKKLVAENS